MFPKISVSSLKYLNGFLPIYKPKGVNCNIVLNCMIKDFNFVVAHSDIGIPLVDISYARPLEPFAHGLITMVLGRSSDRRRNFVFADYKYKAKVEFGVERRFDCIDGDVIQYKYCDNLTEEEICDKFKNFIGINSQEKQGFIARSDCQTTQDKLSNFSEIYNLITFEREPRNEKAPQKYPLLLPPRVSECHSIKLTEFNLPFVSFDIHCKGGFTIRRFVHDLAESLNTKASLVDLNRYEEGPMSLEDERVIDLHEMNLEYYLDRIPAIQTDYCTYLSDLDSLFKTPPSSRRV